MYINKKSPETLLYLEFSHQFRAIHSARLIITFVSTFFSNCIVASQVLLFCLVNAVVLKRIREKKTSSSIIIKHPQFVENLYIESSIWQPHLAYRLFSANFFPYVERLSNENSKYDCNIVRIRVESTLFVLILLFISFVEELTKLLFLALFLYLAN